MSRGPVSRSRRIALALGAMTSAALSVAAVHAQSPPRALRAEPVEAITVNPGFRDWSPTTIAGTTLYGGNQSNRGGLVAIDTANGRLKWTYRPILRGGTASLSTAPAVAGNLVIAPFATAHPGAVKAVALATGKEVWSGPDPVIDAAVAVDGGTAFILAKDGNVYALEAATGKEKWKTPLSSTRIASCASAPVVRDGTIYLTGSAPDETSTDPSKASYFLFAVDAATGKEQWRYRAEAPYVHPGVCLRQPVVTADTIFAAGESRVYAVNRVNGANRWPPLELRALVEGRDRPVDVYGLVDAGDVVAGVTPVSLVAISKSDGRVSWNLPGAYRTSSPSTAFVEGVLYFQGSPDVRPAAASGGTLHALDLDTRTILWSFSRATPEPNWSFGDIAIADGALWVDSYQALIKLQ